MDNFLDWLLLNLPFLCAIVLLIIRMVVATKRGMVKEICSVIATIVASFAVLLIALAVRKYIDQEKIIFIITLVLLSLLGIVYKIIDGFLVTIKLIAKLPLVKYVDKVCGIVIAFAETVFVVWVVYCVVMILDVGVFESWVMDCVKNNFVMKFLYEYNYLYVWIAPISSKLQDINIAEKLALITR